MSARRSRRRSLSSHSTRSVVSSCSEEVPFDDEPSCALRASALAGGHQKAPTTAQATANVDNFLAFVTARANSDDVPRQERSDALSCLSAVRQEIQDLKECALLDQHRAVAAISHMQLERANWNQAWCSLSETLSVLSTTLAGFRRASMPASSSSTPTAQEKRTPSIASSSHPMARGSPHVTVIGAVPSEVPLHQTATDRQKNKQTKRRRDRRKKARLAPAASEEETPN
jgi:hypothetical protein